MHQERTIQELNEIVCRQELAIERLERDMRQHQEQMKMLVPSFVRSADEEDPPPHY
jgi:uncharacterized coiled-coil protein SlyX